MTIEERIAYLQQAAMEEARAAGNALVKKHERKLAGVLEAHKDEANKQLKIQAKSEMTRAKQERSLALSKAQLELKREYGKRQLELKNELFDEVREKLQEFMGTEKYVKLLIGYIREAVQFANGNELTLYINPTDVEKKEYLEEMTGTEITISKEDFIGGVRAVIRGRNVLIDHAFKGAIEKEYQDFMFRGGAGIG